MKTHFHTNSLYVKHLRYSPYLTQITSPAATWCHIFFQHIFAHIKAMTCESSQVGLDVLVFKGRTGSHCPEFAGAAHWPIIRAVLLSSQ